MIGHMLRYGASNAGTYQSAPGRHVAATSFADFPGVEPCDLGGRPTKTRYLQGWTPVTFCAKMYT